MENENITEDNQKLDTFLRNNYYLFNVLSVFGAIALLIATVSRFESTTIGGDFSALSINVGIVGSLLSFIIIGFLINRKFLSFAIINAEDKTPFGPQFVLNLSFLFFFNMVVVSVVSFIIIFPQTSNWVIYGVGVPVMGSVWFYVMRLYGKITNPNIAAGVSVSIIIFTFVIIANGDPGILVQAVNTGLVAGTAGYTSRFIQF